MAGDDHALVAECNLQERISHSLPILQWLGLGVMHLGVLSSSESNLILLEVSPQLCEFHGQLRLSFVTWFPWVGFLTLQKRQTHLHGDRQGAGRILEVQFS